MRGFVFLLLSSALLAQVPPDPRELLARADAPIFTAKTVRLAAIQSTGFAGVAAASPANPFKMEFVRGGRGRAEFLAGNTTITLMVFDGANLWEYHDLGNQYTKRAAPAWIFQGEIATLDYGRNPANIAAASYENEETIDFGGRPVPCYVVRADYRGAPNNRLGKGVVRRVWISKDAEMILRDYWEGPLTPFMGTARMAATTNYTVIETDIPLADELFVFHPPPGSKLGEPIVPGGVIGGVVSGSLAAPPPPPPPPPPKTVEEKPAGTQRINVSAAVQRAKLVHSPRPVYPPSAKQQRIQGVVKLRAVISKDGTIQDVQVISGHQLLTAAAVEAVKHWVYQPTMIDGEPVEVMTQVDVTFTLGQ